MLAGSTARFSRPQTDSLSAELSVRAGLRGAVIWITGVTGIRRADLVGAVRRKLESRWAIQVLTPERLDAWLRSADEETAAIVVSTGSAAAANARLRVGDADRPFVEIVAVSDWDALVEHTDSGLFEHVAGWLAHLGHALAGGPHDQGMRAHAAHASARRATRPEGVVRLDWHGPSQIERRVAEALHRAGLVRSAADLSGTAKAVPSTRA